MQKIALFAAFAILLIGPVPSRAATSTPFVIDVILSLTGTGAFLGNTEAQTLAALEQVANKQGGIAGQPVKFNISDDQSNPVISVQLANQLIAKHVPVMLGSSTSSVCRSVAPLVEKTGPLHYCFSPGMHGTAGGYVFSSGVASADVGTAEVRFFRERGYTQLAIVSSTDSSGQQDIEWFNETLRLPENKDVRLVADERFNNNDVSVAAQMARIKAARPQVIVIKATGAAFGTVLRAFSESGMEIPVSASGSNLIYSQLAQYKGFAPKETYFTATRGVIPDPALSRGAIKDAETTYFRTLAAAGIQPSNNAVLAWDPAWIVIGALRKLGPAASAEDLHRYLQGLHGWTGVSGAYDFRGGNQRGIGPDALLVYRWEPADNRFVVASKAGGRLK